MRLCWLGLLVAGAIFCPSSRAASPQGSSDTSAAARDFKAYRSQIEPIFLKEREGGVKCYNCHSVLSTRLHLEKLSGGATTWTEQQSRANFLGVAKLVVAGDPEKSRLLLHPLAPTAGGDPTHTGGKFWKSQDDPEWQMLAEWVRNASPTGALARAANGPTLDYEFFKTRVEPILLKRREGHARCYVCHKADAEAKRTNFRLPVLAPGSDFWTEEQSRHNFETISQYVVPGDPLNSRLLMHLLAPEAGGDSYHTGGRQFASQKDPDWLILAAWVQGQKANVSAEKR